MNEKDLMKMIEKFENEYMKYSDLVSQEINKCHDMIDEHLKIRKVSNDAYLVGLNIIITSDILPTVICCHIKGRIAKVMKYRLSYMGDSEGGSVDDDPLCLDTFSGDEDKEDGDDYDDFYVEGYNVDRDFSVSKLNIADFDSSYRKGRDAELIFLKSFYKDLRIFNIELKYKLDLMYDRVRKSC